MTKEKTVKMSIYPSQSMYDKLVKDADKLGYKVSGLVRKQLEYFEDKELTLKLEDKA